MSNFALASGDDFPAAATKHLEDATVLFNENRCDGAAYLSGYVVECVLKTLIMAQSGAPTPPLIVPRGGRGGHDLNDLSRQVLSLVSSSGLSRAPSAITRYVTQATAATALRYGIAPGEWKETIRYCAEGFVPSTTAAGWFAEATRLHTEVVSAMRRDGIIIS